jgi:hypothetical protein
MKSHGLRFSPRSLFVSVAALGMFGGMLGCPVINTEHCAYPMGGGTVCAEGLMCSKCEIDNNGCVAPDVVSVDCMFAAGTTGPTSESLSETSEPTTTTTTPDSDPDTTLPTATETTTEVPGTTSTGETIDPDTTATTNTTGTECNPNEGMAGCATPQPYCSAEGACIPCDAPGFDCAALDPDKAACDVESGLCVECISNGDCDESEPFCDVDTATCNTCTTHEHCPESACNLETGECLPEDNVIYVEYTPTMNNVMYCSDAPGNDGHDSMMPICRLNIALTRVTPDKAATIKLKQGQMPQDQANIVPAGVTLAIVKNGNTPVALARNSTESALSVSGGSHVFVYRIPAFSTTKGLTSQLITCDGDSSLWLDRVSVYDGKNGVFARDCMLHVRRSVVFQNTSGGIDLTTDQTMSKLWLENSYVTDNGDVYGIRAAKNSFLDIVYSTIAANTKTVAPPQISCTATPSDNMRLRNSLLADNLNNYVTGCEQAVPADDDTNYLADMKTTLQDLVDAGIAASFSSGVVRAKSNGPLAGVAVWKLGDPAGDFDMDGVRPNSDGDLDYAGADVP